MEFVIATKIEGTWYFINQEFEPDWGEMNRPTNSIWHATRFKNKEKAIAVKNGLEKVNYNDWSGDEKMIHISKDVWKVFELKLNPEFIEVE